MIVSLETVLKIYESLLTQQLSYDQADRWAWKMIELHDEYKLVYEPPEDKELLWELITYLYGIDVPSMTDRNQTARRDIDIIDFLKEKGLYRL